MFWWKWPDGPEDIYRNFYRATAWFAVWFLSGFDVFLWAGGGEPQLIQIDSSEWHPMLQTFLAWLNDPVKLVVVAILLGLLIWRKTQRKAR